MSTVLNHSQIFAQEILPLMDEVYTFAWRLTNDSTKADDLVQETYLRAWRFIGKYEAGTNARAWLFRICRNAFINDYRSKSRDPYKVDFEDVEIYHNADDPSQARYMDLNSEMFNKLMGDEVTGAINALDGGNRLVLLLDLEDFSYEEIAAIAEIPIGTVRSRLHRARKTLAGKLRDYAMGMGFEVDGARRKLAPVVDELT